MCGRVAQSSHALQLGAALLYGNTNAYPSTINHTLENSTFDVEKDNDIYCQNITWNDNWNLAPGMESIVYLLDDISNNYSVSIHSHIRPSRKVWGIIPKSGTYQSPLPTGPNKHFSHLMYNARSETLYEKHTFRNLALKGNTCIWVIDGFFEWADDEKDVIETSDYKQPYYVYHKDKKPLLIAGLWHKVKTGYKIPKSDEDEILETFTILTTETCSNLYWLNDRQPVILWDVDVAIQWLQGPTENLVQHIAHTSTEESNQWLTLHPVHKQMTNQKYRSPQSIDAIRVEKVPSVVSYFTKHKRSITDLVRSHEDISTKASSPSPRIKNDFTTSRTSNTKSTLDSFLKKELYNGKDTTTSIKDDPTNNEYATELDLSVLSELPKDIADEILQNQSLYLQQNKIMKKMKPSPQKGIQSYFAVKKEYKNVS